MKGHVRETGYSRRGFLLLGQCILAVGAPLRSVG